MRNYHVPQKILNNPETIVLIEMDQEGEERRGKTTPASSCVNEIAKTA